MKNSLSQKGFTIFEGLLVAVVLAAIVFVGAYVLNNQEDSTVNPVEVPQASEQVTEEPIQDVADFDEVEKELGDIDLEELDTTELEHPRIRTLLKTLATGYKRNQ